jgi:two-component system response regulator GlrR
VFGAVVDTIERAARTDASVILLGESGTGKEVLAHHLHDRSLRAERPFVPLDCTTIPENLVESELFGHVRGAFSGAERSRPGLLHVADKGTLFLDEVGDLPLAFQPKLLRVIQEGQLRRVGAQDYETVDVRYVCATNRRLDELVEQGRFRKDLFYRLDVVRVEVPPLRERREDIPLIAEQFLGELRERGGCDVEGFAPDALEAITAYHWPGNVRQLRNAVERACALGGTGQIRVQDLPPEVMGLAPKQEGEEMAAGAETFQEMKARRVAAIESSYLESLLRRHGGNVTRCAEEAGMSRSAFQKLMQRYNIKSSDYRA